MNIHLSDREIILLPTPNLNVERGLILENKRTGEFLLTNIIKGQMRYIFTKGKHTKNWYISIKN